MYPTLDGPATTLDDLHLTLRPEPLIPISGVKLYTECESRIDLTWNIAGA